MENERPDPEMILAAIQKEEAKNNKGKLKIFLGMCPGVGKTFAMLQAAKQQAAEGVDVLIGVVETHGRKETEALIDGLVVASKIEKPYRGTVLQEMDIDTILMIRPQLAIVDELAHTNAPGSRHHKRYQDVLELLDAGINVYTTLNVQHVESRAEAVYQITGIQVKESVPDSMLDAADEITLIDLPPEQLLQRLQEGKVYMGERAVTAADHFFREQNLIALREMALRLTAERVNQDLREVMSTQNIRGPWKAGERLMVAVGATPFSESLIRWTRRAAAALNAPWLAVYVEASSEIGDDEKKRLMKNLTLARQLGAEVVVRTGTDVVETLLEVARQNNVSQICVGKPAPVFWGGWFQGRSLAQRLIQQSGDIDIHLIRIKSLGGHKPRRQFFISWGPGHEYRQVLAIVSLTTLIGLGVEKVAGYSSVSLVYLLAVVFSGIYLGRWPVLLLGALSAVLWNYIFIPPRFTFLISKTYDVMMFLMYFVVAVVMGQITTRLREREKAERKQEERVQTLYEFTRMMAVTHHPEEAIEKALARLEDILKVRISLFAADDKGRPDFDTPKSGSLVLSGKERSVANYAFQKQHPSGLFTETLPDSACFYLPLISLSKTLGVLAIQPVHQEDWSLDQRNLAESFASLITVILEKENFVRIAEEAKIKMESDKLQAALLDSVSHELKTPLTVIAGSAEHLDQKNLGEETFHKLVAEIRTASRRLLQTVNSLLDMTRLDSGKIQPSLEWHDIRDIVESALGGLDSEGHPIQVKYADGLPLIKVDAAMIRQVFFNLLSNAVIYSPAGREISVSVQADQNALIASVSDHGPGIDAEDSDKIFEKFYRGKHSKTGGLGLGLSITRRFVQAHGGEIDVRNLSEGGACFVFRLPVEFFNESEKRMGI